ncbi:MAG: exodeoxyribonuclease VII large subunit [Saprospiraceae bacterium]|nr:exodeoxyribonuclease VII large subunit [Saprospiraceae bacterium]
MMTYSLLDLNAHIRYAVALNFPEAIWVTAEIAQVNEARGHIFMDLVQKGEGEEGAIVAQAAAILWQRQYRQLRLQRGHALDEALCEGREVRLQVRVDFHERYGLKLIVLDADPAYTIGRMELQRRQTLKQLEEAGLLERNRSLPMPCVLQHIAVISSEGAAGLQDFQEHLRQNAFGFAFHLQLFSTAVQGENLEAEFLQALQQVALQAQAFDCAVVLRGGGARLDLSGFDALSVCRAAALLPIPLLTGIGHETDETVLDRVAYASLKTPTAVADYLIQHNLFFEGALLQWAEQVNELAQQHLRQQHLQLAHWETAAQWAAQTHLRSARQQLAYAEQTLPALARQTLRRAYDHLQRAETLCNALHPDAALRRGFSLTRKNGRVITSTQDAQPGDVIETQMADGAFRARVE